MRSRTRSIVTAGVSAFALVALLAPGASAHGTPAGTAQRTLSAQSPSPKIATRAKGGKVCFKNMVLKHATGADIPSNNYDDQNSVFDSQAADDFTLTQPCLVREVDVAGTFDKASVVDWENVYIYPGGGSAPGSPAIWVQSSLDGTQGAQPGSFKIKFGPLQLQPGAYWISVQVQLTSGQWGWDNTSDASGSPAVFQNADGGFPGCPTWKPIQTCFPGTPGPDLMFTIKS